MKEAHSSLIIFLAFILSIIAGTLLWDKINLPYNNPQEIIGNYSKLKVNMHTDTLRYLIYIHLIKDYLSLKFHIYQRKV